MRNHLSKLLAIGLLLFLWITFSYFYKKEVDKYQPSNLSSNTPPLTKNFGELFDKEFLKDVKQFSKKIGRNNIDRVNDEDGFWLHRGPANIGGRTRSIAIDATDERVLFAGGVTGGLWKSKNKGLTWDRVTPLDEAISIASIAQDTREGFTQNWFFVTGENHGVASSGSHGAPDYPSDGIYMSIDKGNNWRKVSEPITSVGNGEVEIHTFYKIQINPLTGEVLVAHNQGLSKLVQENNESHLRSIIPGNRDLDLLLVSNSHKKMTYTDLLIDSEGIAYFTASYSMQQGNERLNRRSKLYSYNNDITSDITSNFFDNLNIERSVMDVHINDQNQKKIFIFSSNFNPAVGQNNHYLHIGTFGNNILWEDRSNNLPFRRGGLDNGCHNQVIKVKPNNENIIFLGSVYLFRSNDGFQTNENIDTIGRAYFSEEEKINRFHVDQHDIQFFGSNNEMLVANDGGVFTTNNCVEEAVDGNINWQSLNNGFITSQLYKVAISPVENDRTIVGCFQDNGIWVSFQEDRSSKWKQVLSGDGIQATYTSSGNAVVSNNQFWRLYKGDLDRYDESASRSDDFDQFPNSSFRGEFVIDPNNNDIAYAANDNVIRRYSDINNGWDFTEIENLPLDRGEKVTSLSISTNPSDILYVGTSFGKVLKLRNVNNPEPNISTLLDGNLVNRLPVTDITNDTENANRVIISYGGLQIRSLFYSNDGGERWHDIGGNLEENPDGSGAGPSINAVAIQKNNNELIKVLVGTQYGLFSTTELSLNDNFIAEERLDIQWQMEAEELVGSNTITSIQTRNSDGYTAISTYGNGAFTYAFNTPFVKNKINDCILFNDGSEKVIDLDNFFSYPIEGVDLFYQIMGNSNSNIVNAQLENNYLTISSQRRQTGTSYIRARARFNDKFIDEIFKITVLDPQEIDDQAFGVPNFLSINQIGLEELQLFWSLPRMHNENDEEPPLGVVIERRNRGSNNFQLLDIIPYESATYIDATVIPNETYEYRLKIINADAYSPYTETLSGKALGAPTLRARNVSHRSITLAWSAQVDQQENILGYEVLKSSSLNGNFRAIGNLNNATNSFVDRSVSEARRYFYKVKRNFTFGTSITQPFEVKTTLKTPTELKAKRIAGSDEVALKWNDNSGNESGYRVYRAKSILDFKNGNVVLVTELGKNANTHLDNVEDEIVFNFFQVGNQKYFYQVEAFNASPEYSSFSKIVEVENIRIGIFQLNGRIASQNFDKVLVYPNPVNTSCIIKLPELLLKGKSPIKVSYSLYDLSGKEILHGKQEIIAEEINLNLKNLDKGQYIIKISTSSNSFTSILNKL